MESNIINGETKKANFDTGEAGTYSVRVLTEADSKRIFELGMSFRNDVIVRLLSRMREERGDTMVMFRELPRREQKRNSLRRQELAERSTKLFRECCLLALLQNCHPWALATALSTFDAKLTDRERLLIDVVGAMSDIAEGKNLL